jgi:DHA1 family bicyclomycin/chloramphenicol resistance-like MFS transporter
MASHSTEALIAWRVLQALGGCAAGVASMASVRDLFSVREGAQVFSLLMLILGASPLLAPTIGGILAAEWGWRAVFVTLAAMACLLLWAVSTKLPESRGPDPTASLNVFKIFKGFGAIAVHPQFYTHVFSSAIAFSGLFVYLAGSPIIFMERFGVGPRVYGWIFAIIAGAFIGMSQLNAFLLRKHPIEKLLTIGYTLQVFVGFFFVLGVWQDWYNLPFTVAMFFLFMGNFGFINSNSTALALAPFGANAGSASALTGFAQMSLGALASTVVGFLGVKTTLPVVAMMVGGSYGGFAILLLGRRKIPSATNYSESDAGTL